MLEPAGQAFGVELAGFHTGFLGNADGRFMLLFSTVRGFLEPNFFSALVYDSTTIGMPDDFPAAA
jgi:hypothetical protein